MNSINQYCTIIFDCDGVLINSNHIKTDAFYQCILPYGEAAAQSFVDYHIKNGGISRYKKFEYFLKEIDQNLDNQNINLNIENLLNEYAKIVKKGLMQCEIAEGLYTLRQMTKNAKWFVVSGSDQQELREIFALRGLANLFDGGIFGSPDTKDHILAREFADKHMQLPSLFLGDSRYDHEAACNAGLDFIFVYGWSEMENWKNWTDKQGIKSIKDILEISMLFGG